MGHAWPCSELVVLDARSCIPMHDRCTPVAAPRRGAGYFRAVLYATELTAWTAEMETLLHNRQQSGSIAIMDVT